MVLLKELIDYLVIRITFFFFIFSQSEGFGWGYRCSEVGDGVELGYDGFIILWYIFYFIFIG